MRRVVTKEAGDADDLFDRIRAFLIAHRLSPDPDHYRFVHQILACPDGAVAQAVSRLVDGGFRLQRDDIERLGGTVAVGAAPVRRTAGDPADTRGDELVAETQAQVQGFADTVRAMHDATRGFGRHLAQSAAEMSRQPSAEGMTELVRITGTMIDRIHDTEVRLAAATAETDVLRARLAEARDDARRDPLTGLANRLAFDEAFAACHARTGPCCLAVCDIDRFKRINDEHGHGVGDRVLSAIGQTLASECEGHLVVRHGGEEFAVLFCGVTLVEAGALLERARLAVGGKRFRNRDTDVPIGRITVSAGATTVVTGESGAAAFARADRLLYAAKEAGRDRVLVA